MGKVETYAIVGANLAGGTAAGALRDEGFDGRVLLLGDEPHPPYERPPLSKEYLRGEQPFEDSLVRAPDWWGEHEVDARFGVRVERIDVEGRTLHLEGGDAEPFDKLLVATGARNRRFPIPGLDLEGVLDLRRIDDADRIREAAANGGRAVVVGMGFIGAEVTASLRALGVDVTVVEPFDTPLYRVLGPDIGRVVADIHTDQGVKMVFGDSVDRFEGDKRVEAVVTKNGAHLECAFAVVGVGVQPNVEIAEGTGLDIANGILVDAALRTNVPGIFAAGDVANHDHPVFGRIRVEHYDNALKMGQAAARSMMGGEEPFDDPHWFWSDQYDQNIQMAGFALEWDQIVVRGSVEDRRFSAFYLKDGVILSALGLNRPRDVRRAMPLIKASARPDPDELRDDEVDLRTLVPRES